MVAGVVGVAVGLLAIVYPPAVPEGSHSYPFPAGVFATTQALLFLRDVGLTILLISLGTSGIAGTSKLGRIGAAGSALAMLVLAALEVVSIVVEDTTTIGAAYGLASFVIGLFMMLTGIAVLRARVRTGWHRYLPLVLGLYVFVPMTPAIVAGFVLGQLVIAGWMVLFVLLGRAVARPELQPVER